MLQMCTMNCESELLYSSCLDAENMRKDGSVTEHPTEDSEIDQMAHYVNLLSNQNSIFNNPTTQEFDVSAINSNPSTLSIISSNIESTLLHQKLHLLDKDCEDHFSNEASAQPMHRCQIQTTPCTIVTVLTKILSDLHVTAPLQIPNHPITEFTSDVREIESSILSMEMFASTNNLDQKQSIAFKAICSSFMLSFLMESHIEIDREERNTLKMLLCKKGACDQLLMCVTGPGGSGKSHVIKCCRQYCKHFCDAIKKPFHFSVFPVTATSNAAASLIQGITIHSAALLNNTIVQMELSTDVDWTLTKVLIIDEISMADKRFFKTLDRNLRILTGNRNALYGGVHIIFTGDFMQLAPVQGIPIYKDFDDILWHGSLNAAVFFDEKNHRFINDMLWGEILGRAQVGLPTDEDIDIMNQRLIQNIQLPTNVDCARTKVAYGCYSNRMRNFITNGCFLKFVASDSPAFNSSGEPSQNTLIIKGFLTKQNRDVGLDFHKMVWALCGDDNVTSGDSTKVDPCLKLIKGCPLMINTNSAKKNGMVKGNMCTFVGVRWKPDCSPHVEDYYGFKVNCAHVQD
jgi:hypothetical protein